MKCLMSLLVSHLASFYTLARCSACYIYFLQKVYFTSDCHWVEYDDGSPLILHAVNILINLSHLLYLSIMSKDTNELFSGTNENCNG